MAAIPILIVTTMHLKVSDVIALPKFALLTLSKQLVLMLVLVELLVFATRLSTNAKLITLPELHAKSILIMVLMLFVVKI
jgi:hypothetical protein